MKTLRYAIVGTGMMGQEHLRKLALVNQTQPWYADVVALKDPDVPVRSKATELALALGVTAATTHESLATVNTLFDGAAVQVSAEDGVIAVRLGTADRESIRTEQVVNMNYLTSDMAL